MTMERTVSDAPELIETLWNVNAESPKDGAIVNGELIETLWNVNLEITG